MSGRKICPRCLVDKPVDDYYTCARAKSGLQSYCKTCQKEQDALRRLTRYGLTPESFDELVRQLGGVCPICEEPPVQQGTVLWVIDHNHACCPGEVGCEKCFRGLLCNPCNRAIGLLRDNPSAALNAATYLMSTQNLIGAWS